LKCSSAVGVWEPDCGVRCAASFKSLLKIDFQPLFAMPVLGDVGDGLMASRCL